MIDTTTLVLAAGALALVAGFFVSKPRHHFRTEVIIDAAAERVWSVLTDTVKFPQWNPLVSRLEGKLARGETLRVTLRAGKDSSMDFTPTVVDFQDGREFTWLGSLGIRGIFDGQHRFAVEDLGGERTRLVHEEHFGGVLVPLLKGKLERDSLPLFHAMNLALKSRVENSSVPASS